MRIPMVQRVKQVKRVLLETDVYLKATDIAEKLRVSTGTVYKVVREMRMQGIGVHSTNNGYVLSEYATKRDDVNLLRRVNGRRTSDFILINAAQGSINKRWNQSGHSQVLHKMISPLSPTKSTFNFLKESRLLIDKQLNILKD